VDSSLVLVFEKQFRQWTEASLGKLDACRASLRNLTITKARVNLCVLRKRLLRALLIPLLMLHPSSYHHYARLVIASFGLHRAGDSNLLDMPAALARLQSSATHLIECFENDFDTTGFTRGTQASLVRRRKLLSADKISLIL
jgi:hypothetical protein